MSYDHSTTLRYSAEQQQAIDDIVRESKQTDDVPDLSQSEALRRLIEVGLEHADDLGDLVGEETRILLARQQFKERAAKVNNLRTGFETRVKDNFTRRFKNGYKAEQLSKFAANMREEARILWPEYLIETVDDETAEEYRRRRRECIDYVDAVVEAAIEAVETSEHDPLDPESMFENFGGVEEGRDRRSVQRQGADLEAEARLLLEAAQRPDPDAIATAIAKEHGVARRTAKDAVDAVLEERDGGAAPQGVSADD